MAVEAMKQAIETLELFANDETGDGNLAISAYMALQLAIQQAESQEPVAYRWQTHNRYTYSEIDYEELKGEPLYTAPPKQEWVGLTEQDVEQWNIFGGHYGITLSKLIRSVEAKLKEKNK